MGFFKKIIELFTSTRTPDAGVPVQSTSKVKELILALNRPTAPYTIGPSDDAFADLMAEWKIVDAKWYEIFAKASLQRTFKIYLKFDEEKHEVRALDKEYEVSWSVGVPTLSFSAKYFRGQSQEISFGSAYAFTEELKPGVVYNYRFDTRELKKPIQDAVTGAGWTYRGVVGKM